MISIVTGGSGFIGSHLCKKLLYLEEKVLCIDNLSTGNIKNISNLFKNKNFQFLEHDITNPLYLPYKVDRIYNLACPASPIHYQQDAIKTLKTNILGTMNMLELCKLHSSRFLQASTSEVYGDPEVHPQVENYWGNVNPIGPRACYDEGKRCAETLCFDYKRQHGIDIRVIRIFNTYGPKMALNDGRVISNFIVQALKGEKITIYGTGAQTRSFCYVTDLVSGLCKMMNSNLTGPINLGNPNEYKIVDIAKKIIELTNSKSQLLFKELPEDDPKRRKPNIDLAKTNLNWTPIIKLEQGLENTIEYFKKEYNL